MDSIESIIVTEERDDIMWFTKPLRHWCGTADAGFQRMALCFAIIWANGHFSSICDLVCEIVRRLCIGHDYYLSPVSSSTFAFELKDYLGVSARNIFSLKLAGELELELEMLTADVIGWDKCTSGIE